MKKINYTLALFVCFLITSTSIKAQGNNLQFNSAVHYTYSVAVDGNATQDVLLTTTLIVPANKILKIESGGANALLANGAFYSVSYISIDNTIISSSSGYCPRSLPAGTYTIRISDPAFAIVASHAAYISGILYNIVP